MTDALDLVDVLNPGNCIGRRWTYIDDTPLAMIILKAMVPKFAVCAYTHHCYEMSIVCLADCAFLSDASNLLRAISISDVITQSHRELYILRRPHFDHLPAITYIERVSMHSYYSIAAHVRNNKRRSDGAGRHLQHQSAGWKMAAI